MSEENLITIENAARRMLEKLMQDAELFQEETVDEIESKFGAEFVFKKGKRKLGNKSDFESSTAIFTGDACSFNNSEPICRCRAAK